MSTQSFKDLIVWQRSIELVQEIYILTRHLPSFEQHGLSSQMQRAAVTIPSNIAEGSKRTSTKDYLNFLRISAGSAAELETQLIITHNVYPAIKLDTAFSLLYEVQKMLTVIIKKLAL